VPGLREELVTALIRSLPKHLRVNFVPAPNHARGFLEAVPAGDEPLLDALERHFRATTGVVVPRDAWDWSKVPEHLRPTFRVVDEAGREQGAGKDLEALKEPLRPKFARAIAEVAAESGINMTGQTGWTFGVIEKSFTQTRAGHEVRGFPALVDEGATAGLQVVGSEDEQLARHRLGVLRLLLLNSPDPTKQILDSLGNAEKLALAGSPYPTVAELLEDCRAAVLLQAIDARPPARSPEEYAAVREAALGELVPATSAVLADVMRVLEGSRTVDRLLSGRADMTTLTALTDMKAQLARLVHRGFVAEAGVTQLRRIPVYLRALEQRRASLETQVGRDRQLMDQVGALQDAWLHRVAALPEGRPPGEALRQVGWMLEEYRVSLWAQQLGTAYPVSDARIRKALG
jgi:ATP-dependent helicase HrpA